MSSNGSTAVLKSMQTNERSGANCTAVSGVSSHCWAWSSEIAIAMSMSPERRASRRVLSSEMKSMRILATGGLPPHHVSTRSISTVESGSNFVTL